MIKYVVFTCVSFVIGLSAYFLIENIYIAIIAGCLFLFYFFVFELLINRKSIEKCKKKKDLVNFISNFIYKYIKDLNVDTALEISSVKISSSIKEELLINEKLSSLERINKLDSYFNTSIYHLFLLFINDSESAKKINGRYLNLLLFKLDEIKKDEMITKEGRYKSTIKLSFYFLCSFLIFLFARFAVNNYFSELKNNIIYLIALILFYLISLISVHLTLSRFFIGEKDV